MGKTQKWAVAALAAVAMGGAFTAIAADNNAVANHGHGAAYGSAAVVAGKTYKLADMLTYAIEDEYAARAEYAAIMAKFGEQRPFSNIMRAEQTHIARLTPLFAAHGVALPKDNAAQHVVVPATLAEAFKIGVDAEIKNIAMYEEFLRADVDIDLMKCKFVDVQVVFHKMEQRTLSAAYQFYCEKNLEDAHTAEADTKATYEVLKAQLDRYPDLQNDVEFLSKFTSFNRNVDFAGRIVYNDKDEEIINFGKYKGQKVEDVLRNDMGYYGWMMQGDFPLYTKKVLTNIKLRMFGK